MTDASDIRVPSSPSTPAPAERPMRDPKSLRMATPTRETPLPPLHRMRGLPGGVLLPVDGDGDGDGLVLAPGLQGEIEQMLGEAQPMAAVARLQQDTTLDPATRRTLLARAWLMDGRLDEAKTLLADGPATALGEAALALAENDNALAEEKIAVARNQAPHDVGVAYLHALVRVARGDMAQGAELLSAVARAVPTHAVARFQLGQILFAQGDPARAGTLYEMAWVLQPAFVSPPLALADMLVESRQYGEALSILESVCAAAPTSLPPRQLQLRILVEIGERQAAVDLGRMLHEQVPDDVDTAILYADALIDAERPKDADALLARLIERKDIDVVQRVRLHRLQARIALVERRIDDATRTLRAAAELAPPASCGEVCLELVHIGIAQNRVADIDTGLVLLLRSSEVSALVSGALLARQHHLSARAKALAERARSLVPGSAAAAQLDGFIASL